MPEIKTVQNKENLEPSELPKSDKGLTARDRKPSQIPVPKRTKNKRSATQSKREATLPRAASPPSPQPSLAPRPPSQVKQVPDFKRLHHQWASRLAKKKHENKAPTQIRQFSLTPAGKFSAKKRQTFANQPPATPLNGTLPDSEGKRNGSFEVHEQSLHAILCEQPTRAQCDHRTTIGPSTQTLARVTTADLVSGLRYSIYRRRPHHPGDPHMRDQLPSCKDIFGELLEGLLQTTARINRTERKQKVEEEVGLREIKLNLDFQFSQVADAKEEQKTTSDLSVNPCATHSVNESAHASHDPSQLTPPLPSSKAPLRAVSKTLVTSLTPQSSTQHRHPETPLQPPKGRGHQCLATCCRNTSLNIGLQPVSVGIIPPKGQFYEEEAELALLQRVLPVAMGDRKECPDPVAATLDAQDSDHCFMPIRE